MFVIILLVILVLLYLSKNSFSCYITTKDSFDSSSIILPSAPYNPTIRTPLTNWKEITADISKQLEWKKNLSVALSPTPTIQCDKLKNLDDCNKYGCNWFGTFCSSTYPRDF